MVSVVTSRVSHTTFDCRNAFALSTWWKQVLDYGDVVGDPNEPGDEECVIVDRHSGHQLLFIEVPDEKLVKNRVHLDLVPTDRRRDAEVDRVLALGASQIADLRRPDGSGWVTLADPEGNEFCIVRSDTERATAPRGAATRGRLSTGRTTVDGPPLSVVALPSGDSTTSAAMTAPDMRRELSSRASR